MKCIEIENEKVERHISTNEKRNDKQSNFESKGMVTSKGEDVTLRYERPLSYPREVVWKAISDPIDLAGWMNTKAVIDGPAVAQLILSILYQAIIQLDIF